MFWNQYPYINLNDLNLDFLLKAIGEMQNEVKNFVTLNAVKYADPIQWDITKQYEKNTIVIDPQTGTAYISVSPVPVGISLSNTDYWSEVFNLGRFVVKAAKNFTSRYEEATTTTATFPTNAGEWLVWGDTLYEAQVNITPGDSYVVSGNIKTITIEEITGHLTELTTTDKTNLVSAINELVSSITTEIETRTNEITAINNTIDSISPHITDVINVLKIGVIPNDNTKGAENIQIINDALANKKCLYFPDGSYYIGNTIQLVSNSGIIGNSPYKSKIICTGDFNGIDIPVSVDDPEGVTTNVILKNIGLYGTFSATTQNNSKGLNFYNYTFNVTCNRDATQYQNYNSGYALEYRLSDISNLRIACFQYGIYGDNNTAVITIKDCFIATCQTAGIFLFSSDCILENMNLTYNYNGVMNAGGSNKFTNFKVYQNGRVINASQTLSSPPIGFNIFGAYATNSVLANVEVQDSMKNGLVFSDTHDIILAGVSCNSNGLNADGVGAGFYNCYNISGILLCTDMKTTPTQRLGCYISDDCHDFNILYTEYNNKLPIQNAGLFTYRMLKHTSKNYYSNGVLNTAAFTNEGENHPFVYYDGEHLDIHLKVKATGALSAGTEIIDLSEIYDKIPAIGSAPLNIEWQAFKLNDGSFVSLYMASNKLYLGAGINADDILVLDKTYRPRYFA